MNRKYGTVVSSRKVRRRGRLRGGWGRQMRSTPSPAPGTHDPASHAPTTPPGGLTTSNLQKKKRRLGGAQIEQRQDAHPDLSASEVGILTHPIIFQLKLF